MLDSIHTALRLSHIVVGFVCLLLFWVPVLAKKGGRLHITAGKIYVACGYFLIATAYISCLWAISSPGTFAPEYVGSATAEVAVERIANVRFLMSILFVLATWILISLVLGIRVLSARRDVSSLSKGLVRPVFWYSIVVDVVAVCFGGAHLMAGGDSKYALPVLLGIVGCCDALGNLKFIRNPSPTPMAWWYKHMECMLGTGIGFYTAFSVFGLTRLYGLQLSGWTQLVPWLLPTLIGVPAVHLWTRSYKKRFGELDATKMPIAANSRSDNIVA